MASTQTLRALSVLRTSISLRWVEKYFYLCMSLLLAAVVVYGFSHTVENKLIHGNPRRPILLWVHAALFSTWIAFYIIQSVLVRIRKVKLHRTLGWAGAALGTSMIVIGPWVAVVMARFDTNQLHRVNRDAFLIVPLSDMAAFAICFVLAILWRTNPERHRRLMLIASCALKKLGDRRDVFRYLLDQTRLAHGDLRFQSKGNFPFVPLPRIASPVPCVLPRFTYRPLRTVGGNIDIG
jgi:hypothetical protein